MENYMQELDDEMLLQDYLLRVPKKEEHKGSKLTTKCVVCGNQSLSLQVKRVLTCVDGSQRAFVKCRNDECRGNYTLPFGSINYESTTERKHVS
jgi:DNA-directed RNA polymerase subunit RPC12/RpoP